MTDRRTLERLIGSVLAPEVRVAGTVAAPNAIVPSREYLERFPPALVVAFGRTPRGAVSPTPLLERLHATCAELGNSAPLVACDLEQGAGLHFAEGTRFPPALALASAASEEHGADALDWIRAAGECTGAEARALGVDVVLAPVADVNVERDNPIIAVRSFGDDARAAAERALAYALGVHAGGAATCAKHFPGHGNTRRDSHLELPSVARDAATLCAVELEPFRRLVQHGVDSVMVAHLDVPALSGAPGLPTTLSHRVITEILRGKMGFTGVVLSDAMNMGALAAFEPRYARALAAGCDALLCPHDPWLAAEELSRAVGDGSLALERLAQAAERVEAWRAARCTVKAGAWSADWSRSLAAELAFRALRISGPWPAPSSECAIRVLDPVPGCETEEVRDQVELLRARLNRIPGAFDVQPVVCEARAGRGRYGLTAEEIAALSLASGRTRLLLWFGSPQSVPEALWAGASPTVLLALAPTPPCFAAAARALSERTSSRALDASLRRLPTRWG